MPRRAFAAGSRRRRAVNVNKALTLAAGSTPPYGDGKRYSPAAGSAAFSTREARGM